MSMGTNILAIIENDFQVPTTPLTDDVNKDLYISNLISKYAILSGLSKTKFVKGMHCKSSKELWNKLKSCYEGDNKVKKAKLKTYRGQLESFKIEEDKSISSFEQIVFSTLSQVSMKKLKKLILFDK